MRLFNCRDIRQSWGRSVVWICIIWLAQAPLEHIRNFANRHSGYGRLHDRMLCLPQYKILASYYDSLFEWCICTQALPIDSAGVNDVLLVHWIGPLLFDHMEKTKPNVIFYEIRYYRINWWRANTHTWDEFIYIINWMNTAENRFAAYRWCDCPSAPARTHTQTLTLARRRLQK